MNFANFLRTPFLQNTSGQLLLDISQYSFLQGLPEALFVNPFSLKSFSFEYRGFSICSIEQIELRWNFNRFANFLGS